MVLGGLLKVFYCWIQQNIFGWGKCLLIKALRGKQEGKKIRQDKIFTKIIKIVLIIMGVRVGLAMPSTVIRVFRKHWTRQTMKYESPTE